MRTDQPSFKKGLLYIIASTCLTLFISSPAPCEEVVQDQADVVTTVPASFVISSVSLENALLVVERMLAEKKFAQTDEYLTSLLPHARELGLRNLSSFSVTLLNHAQLLADNNKKQEAAFLVRKAVEISPTDARIFFSAAGFTESLGWMSSVKYLFKALWLGQGHPSIVMSIATSALFLTLVAGTLALLIVTVVQFICNVKRVLLNASKKKALKSRGLWGPWLVLGFMLIPLYGGLGVAVCIWALVLSRFVKECRYLSVLAGCLFLLWGLSIPVIQTFSRQVYSPSNEIYEHVKTRSYYIQDVQQLRVLKRQQSEDPFVRFMLGQALALRGDLEAASKELNSLYSELRLSSHPRLYVALLTNLGGVEALLGKYQVAKGLLEEAERLGGNNFELMYDLSQLNLSMLDTFAHRNYYQRAQALDGARLASLQNIDETKSAKAIFTSVSPVLFYQRFFKPLSRIEGMRFSNRHGQATAVAQTMMAYGTPWRLAGLGVVVIVLGFIMGVHGRADFYRVREGALEDQSPLWLFLPGGLYVSGRSPVVGLAAATCILALVIAGLGKPSIVVSSVPIGAKFLKGLLIGAAAMFMATSLWSFVTRNFRSEVGPVARHS